MDEGTRLQQRGPDARRVESQALPRPCRPRARQLHQNPPELEGLSGRSSAFFYGQPLTQSGKVMGNWPGLGSGQLDRGVDLAVTTDYREVLKQAIRS